MRNGPVLRIHLPRAAECPVPYRDAHRKTHLRSYSARCLSTAAVSRLTPGMQMTPVHHVDSAHPQTKDRGTYPSAKQTPAGEATKTRAARAAVFIDASSYTPSTEEFPRDSGNCGKRITGTMEYVRYFGTMARSRLAARSVRQNVAPLFFATERYSRTQNISNWIKRTETKDAFLVSARRNLSSRSTRFVSNVSISTLINVEQDLEINSNQMSGIV